MEERKKSIGGIWKKTTKKGDIMLSMRVEIDGKQVELIAFKNGFKKEDKHPDFQIYMSEPFKPQGAPVQKEEPVAQDDDDLPF